MIDNLLIEGNTPAVVLISGGRTVLEGTTGPPLVIGNWASGPRYQSLSGQGGHSESYVTPTPSRPGMLVDANGNWFQRSRPAYEDVGSGGFVVATDHGISNGMSGDQANAINSLLASNVGTPIFFPAGIYLIGSTINVPVGSILVGEMWSQFMAFGSFFSDVDNPKVMMK